MGAQKRRKRARLRIGRKEISGGDTPSYFLKTEFHTVEAGVGGRDHVRFQKCFRI
jgi:hypothetical protein